MTDRYHLIKFDMQLYTGLLILVKAWILTFLQDDSFDFASGGQGASPLHPSGKSKNSNLNEYN